MSHRYILDENGEPAPEPDLMKWARWFEDADRTVAATYVDRGGIRITISTVFLGMDHNLMGRGPPVLWETMVFGPPVPRMLLGRLRDIRPALDQCRYSKRETAVAHHAEIVKAVRRGDYDIKLVARLTEESSAPD